ncbi:unnamed protein product, partial [Nesidiocoris tenuis]
SLEDWSDFSLLSSSYLVQGQSYQRRLKPLYTLMYFGRISLMIRIKTHVRSLTKAVRESQRPTWASITSPNIIKLSDEEQGSTNRIILLVNNGELREEGWPTETIFAGDMNQGRATLVTHPRIPPWKIALRESSCVPPSLRS